MDFPLAIIIIYSLVIILIIIIRVYPLFTQTIVFINCKIQDKKYISNR